MGWELHLLSQYESDRKHLYRNSLQRHLDKSASWSPFSHCSSPFPSTTISITLLITPWEGGTVLHHTEVRNPTCQTLTCIMLLSPMNRWIIPDSQKGNQSSHNCWRLKNMYVVETVFIYKHHWFQIPLPTTLPVKAPQFKYLSSSCLCSLFSVCLGTSFAHVKNITHQ
jgi:hypothetical protein